MLAWAAAIAAQAWWVMLGELAREHFSADLTVALYSYVYRNEESYICTCAILASACAHTGCNNNGLVRVTHRLT